MINIDVAAAELGGKWKKNKIVEKISPGSSSKMQLGLWPSYISSRLSSKAPLGLWSLSYITAPMKLEPESVDQTAFADVLSEGFSASSGKVGTSEESSIIEQERIRL